MNCSREGAGSWGPSCRKAIQAEAKRAGHFRRFKVYDYSRGAAIFITFGVVGRLQVFGQINAQGELEHSPAGQAAVKALLTEAAKGTGIRLMQFVVMPDHVHLRLYIEPGLEKPLARLANFVRNFKRWSKWLCSKEGVAFDWEPGYHDRLCLSREIIELADKYIRNNPLKWHLMHGDPPPLKVVEPLASGRIANDEWWSAVGATELLGENVKICSVRLSRGIPFGRFSEVIARLESAVDKGFVLAGTFISPCERAVAGALERRGAPMIRVVPDALEMVYRPKGDEPGQFAAGRLLLLSRVAAPGLSRHDAWHGMNDALGEIATAVDGGVSLYVSVDKKGELKWEFSFVSA